MTFLQELEIIGGTAAALMTICTALIFIIKPLRKALRRAFGTNTAQLAMLRNDITNIYYKYLPAKRLPVYVRENLVLLNEAYVNAGGNCYVTTIFGDMMAWDIAER